MVKEETFDKDARWMWCKYLPLNSEHDCKRPCTTPPRKVCNSCPFYTKQEDLKYCPYRDVELSSKSDPKITCTKIEDTMVFDCCLKCDAFKGKDSLDKTWDPDAKDSKSPFLYQDACRHYHENDYGDWCELNECDQVFEKCKKCCAHDKNVDEAFEKACQALKHYSNDQTAKADAGKAKLSLVPQKINYAIARVREYGNNKYPEGGKDNWKRVEKQRYVDAMLRHISAYVSDPEGIDEESGLPHLWHAACDMAFILEKEDE